MKNIDCYEVLGINPNANVEEIKKSYKKKAQVYHPDKNNGSAAAHSMFQLIQRAHDILLDPQKRLEHDYQFGYKNKPKKNSKNWLMVGLGGLFLGYLIGNRNQKDNR